MYSTRKLITITLDGLDDMLPAVRAALADSDGLDRLVPVYGQSPRSRIVILALAALLLGLGFDAWGPDFPGKQFVTWPAVVLGLIFALIFRHFLFQSQARKQGKADFALLAASLIPAVGIVLLGVTIAGDARVALAPTPHSGGVFAALGTLVLWLTGLLGIVAAITISVASLCYSRDWLHALKDLAIRLLTFRIIIWVMSLIMIEFGIIGNLVGMLLTNLLSLSIPQWIPDFVDQVSYAALLSLAYLAVIGGTWTVCRDNYQVLLQTGHVDILTAVSALLDDEQPATSAEEG